MRAHRNILRICPSIRQSKHLVAGLEPFFPSSFLAQLCNCSRELDAEDLRRMRRYGVVAFTLEQVHAVQSKGFDLDQGLGFAQLGLGHVGDVQG